MKYLPLFLLLMLAACSVRDSYDYVPLSQYKYKHAQLQPGAQLQLIAFSGKGRNADSSEVFYYQFIVSSGGKKCRVLAPTIRFRMDDGTYTDTDPSMLQKNETPLTATYAPVDSSTHFAMQVMQLAETSSKGTLDNDELHQLEGHVNLKELVVLPTGHPELFRDEKMPTVLGVLQFERKPW